MPASLPIWALLPQRPVLYLLRVTCLSSGLGSRCSLPAMTTCDDTCVFVCHMKGLCEEGKFGVHPRIEKKEDGGESCSSGIMVWAAGVG